VLADFPKRAFDISLEPTQVLFDNNRKGVLRVPFHLSWNQGYVTSLSEAVSVTNQRADCGRSWLNKCQYVAVVHGGYASAYYDDTVAQDIMHREIIISRPLVQLSIRDTYGTVRYRECYSFPEIDHSRYSPWRYADIGPGIFTVNHRRTKRFEIDIDLSILPPAQLDRVEITIVRAREC
jgi:hypothetical protein